MRSTSTYQGKLAELEQALQNSLSPVAPNPKFIDELNLKLHNRQVIDVKEKSMATAYLLMSFGLFFGVFIFWLVRKIVRANRQCNAMQA